MSPVTERTKSLQSRKNPALRRFKNLGIFELVLAASALSLGACAAPPKEPASPPPEPPPAPPEHIPPPALETSAEEPLVKIIADAGFSTPESVYFDKKRDTYLVSNVNGAPHAKDGNGFISKLTPEGEVTPKFIDGGTKGVTLNAPKGLTVSGDTLYVADIDHVRMFDAATGEPKGEVEIKGASMVNDVATGKEGVVYLSDTGVDEKWEPDGKAAIYSLKDGKVKKLFADKTKLGSPNGILAGEGGVWVVSGTGELFWISDAGKQEQVQKISGGYNDGIILAEDGRFFVSSWADGAVYAGKPGGEFTKEISGLTKPADIGYDCKRNRVLIPGFAEDRVILHSLK